jgi:hypothetical protein
MVLQARNSDFWKPDFCWSRATDSAIREVEVLRGHSVRKHSYENGSESNATPGLLACAMNYRGSIPRCCG